MIEAGQPDCKYAPCLFLQRVKLDQKMFICVGFFVGFTVFAFKVLRIIANIRMLWIRFFSM